MLGFLRDVSEPYLRIFRRFIKPIGMFDLSPMIAIFVLYFAEYIVVGVIQSLVKQVALMAGTHPAIARRTALLRAIAVTVVVVVLDQLTKHLVIDSITPGEVVHVLPGLQLVHWTNSGVAFSCAAGGGVLVYVLSAVALARAARLLRSATRAAAGCGCRPGCSSAARSAT